MKNLLCDTGFDSVENPAMSEPAPYYASASVIETAPGCWNKLSVDIIERASGNLIGNYRRNYSRLYRTFHPFKLKGNWYALYSRDYTCTRIMSLPDCKDIGGEEPDSDGFCPTDFFVPGLKYLKSMHLADCPRFTSDYTKSCTCTIQHRTDCPKKLNGTTYDLARSCICVEEKKLFDDWEFQWQFPERVHGFVAGCMWGGDSSWKIEYLDLSMADQGILRREAKFGYLSMPQHLNLNQSVELHVSGLDDSNEPWVGIKIASENHYNFKTGKVLGD